LGLAVQRQPRLVEQERIALLSVFESCHNRGIKVIAGIADNDAFGDLVRHGFL